MKNANQSIAPVGASAPDAPEPPEPAAAKQPAPANSCGAAWLVLLVLVLWLGTGALWWARPLRHDQISGRTLGHRIDLNSADAPTLALLPGVGLALAQRIVDYREQRGGFSSVDDLNGVLGFGPRVVERLRPYVVCHPKAGI